MRHYTRTLLLVCALMLCSADSTIAQQQATAETLSSDLIGIIRHSNLVHDKIDKRLKKTIDNLVRQDGRILRRAFRFDSAAARHLMPVTPDALLHISSREYSRYNLVYSGKLDSLRTSLFYLLQTNKSVTNIDSLISMINKVQTSISNAARVSAYATMRLEKINDVLAMSGLHRRLKRYKAKLSQYRSQLKSLNTLVNEPSSTEEKLISTVAQSQAFKTFFAKHSQLAQIFSLPGSESINKCTPVGIQTRELLQKSIAEHFGKGITVQQLLEANVPSAQSELVNIKKKLQINKKGVLANSSHDLSQQYSEDDRTTNRIFLHRLKYGANIQTQRTTYYFPVTSDIALTLAYRISKNTLLGVGLSSKIGWGTDWKHIAITHQGLGIRSNVDSKFKRNYYITAAYERNYRTNTDNSYQLRSMDRWSSAGLIGAKKIYSINKKLNGHVQILWDFFSYYNQSNTPPILFRMGYELK